MDQETLKAQFLAAYERHADELYRFIYFKISNKEKAEDVTQEVFIELWQALRKKTKIKNTRAFLFTVARNRIIDWYRKKKSVSLETITSTGVEFQGDDASSVTMRTEFDQVVAAMEQLDDASREVVQLRHIEGFTPQEIADVTGESANAVSVRLNRATKRLKELLHANTTT